MVRVTVAVCLVLGVTTLSVVRGQLNVRQPGLTVYHVEPDLSYKFRSSVGAYARQLADVLKPIEETLDGILSIDRGDGGGGSWISTTPIVGPVVDCSRTLVSSIIKPVKSVLGAVIFLYAHARAFIDGILDCIETNGIVAPISLVTCLIKYTSYTLRGVIQSLFQQLLQAIKEIFGLLTGNWIVECVYREPIGSPRPPPLYLYQRLGDPFVL